MSFYNFKTFRLTYLIIGFLVIACPLYKDPVRAPADLQISPNLLDFDTANSTLIFTIINDGRCQYDLTWTMPKVSTLAWIKNFSANTGTLEPGSQTQIMLTIDRNNLGKVGQNEQTIPITAEAIELTGHTKHITIRAFKAVLPSLTMLDNAVTDKTPTTAKARAIIDDRGSSNIKQYGHVWSPEPTPTLDAAARISQSENRPAGAFESIITGLKPATKYYIRAYATNAEGVGYSPVVSFETKKPVIMLANTSIAENSPVNTIIGRLSTTDTSMNYTYTLVSGRSDFKIDGNNLRTSKSFDYETKNRYIIILETRNEEGERFQKAFTITVSDVNEAPTAIALSKTSIAENNPINTLIGTLNTTDPDTDDLHIYTLISGHSDFKIEGRSLRTAKVLDYETKNSYVIEIETNDNKGGTFRKDFTITVTDTNEAPTAIALSKTSIAENNPINTVIGTLSTTDPNTDDRHTYTLVSGRSDFKIDGNNLRASKVFDYEANNNYVIRIETNDGKGGTFQKEFTIMITGGDGKSTMTYNGKTYKTSKIGMQWWMAENLNDSSHTSGSSFCYADKTSNCDTYGLLYSWAAAADIAAKVPGWHLPTDDEWKTLERYLGMSESALDSTGFRGTDEGTKLKQSDSLSFNALLSGYYFFLPKGGDFISINEVGFFWSASPFGNGTFWGRYVFDKQIRIGRSFGNRGLAISVRLIKD